MKHPAKDLLAPVQCKKAFLYPLVASIVPPGTHIFVVSCTSIPNISAVLRWADTSSSAVQTEGWTLHQRSAYKDAAEAGASASLDYSHRPDGLFSLRGNQQVEPGSSCFFCCRDQTILCQAWIYRGENLTCLLGHEPHVIWWRIFVCFIYSSWSDRVYSSTECYIQKSVTIDVPRVKCANRGTGVSRKAARHELNGVTVVTLAEYGEISTIY